MEREGGMREREEEELWQEATRLEQRKKDILQKDQGRESNGCIERISN